MDDSAKPGPSTINLVPSNPADDAVNQRLCIICQKDDKVRVTSENEGRQKMKRAAEIRNDAVAKRMKSLKGYELNDDSCMFVYHNNNACYKTYTHKNKLKAIEVKHKETVVSVDHKGDEVVASVGLSKTLRKSITPRAPPSCDKDSMYIACVICGNVRYKQVREKFRICEYNSAKNLIKTATFNQDKVFTRIADRLKEKEEDSVKYVISADLFCHNHCYRAYVRQYERDTMVVDTSESKSPVISNMKHVLFMRAQPYIDKLLDRGDCCTVSNFVDFTKSLLEEGETLTSSFLNRDMKHLITSHYGDSVTFAPNRKVNESDIFFSSSISASDVAIQLKNQDLMKEAGTQLRKELMGVDFGLQDSFCDSSDLKESWEKTMMPASLRTFLAALFHIPNHKLFKSTAKDLNAMLNPLEDEENITGEELPQQEAEEELPQQESIEKLHKQEDVSWQRDHHSTRLHCLFQMIMYNIHGGTKKTPLHMMLGHAIYARDRSKSLLTVFNRIGACASYQTILSARSLLASYAVKCAEDNETPLPSNLSLTDYTQGGMDNSDYADKTSLSGTDDKHYAALVLFQDDTQNKPLRKPPVSSTGLSRSNPILKTTLSCQDVPAHIKPVTRPALPPDMLLHPENKQATLLDMASARNESSKREFLISVIRHGSLTGEPHIWAAVHTLVSPAAVPLMRVGFLPVIPKPITDHATVRHCLTNFQSVRKQLNQTSMAIWCDENVFAQFLDIYLHERNMFGDLFPCMGPFHWTRILLRCQGKLLRGTGLDDALIECAVFGPRIMESALNGYHYVRAMTGMLIVEDVIRSLQWKAFWDQASRAEYPELKEVEVLQKILVANQRCPKEFETLAEKIKKLHQDFRKFELECEAKSELCQYFGVWLKIVAVIKNMVVSEREGNWDLHVASIEDSMPIFAEFDCINYLRHGSWYLEQIKTLEFSHPELYQRFSIGQWVVQDRPGWFCAVGGDMKVEQTIQRVSKGPGGHYVVGASRNASAVAEFELLYHEIGSITNILDVLASNESLKHTECHLQHTLSKTRRIKVNHNVTKLLDSTLLQRNPYVITTAIPVSLHNIFTKTAVDKVVALRLLKCLENGKKIYHSYRKERLVDKTKKISATITKRSLPLFNEYPQNAAPAVKKKKTTLTSKCIAEGYRNIDLAKARGMNLHEILTHDVLSVSPLFEGDLPAHATKSKLMDEVEPHLDMNTWNRNSDLQTHVIVDFMSKLRQMPLAQFQTLGNVITSNISSMSRLSKHVECVHLVFDSYIENSLKECERIRRTDETKGIEIIGMTKDTPVPKQPDKFWASEDNKRNIQLLCRDIVRDNIADNPAIITSSVVSDGEVLPAQMSGGKEIPELLSWIEEADARLIVHVEWAIRVNKCERIIIVSNDTDTFALLLHYTPYFQTLGAKEIWQEYGTGEKKRKLPLHQVVSVLGVSLAKTVIKAHILSGDDCMNKVGSKHAAMASDPVKYLSNFGEESILTEQDISSAEKYLVCVWAGVRSKTTAKTFDELRFENYIGGATGIDSLPPTSSVIRGHIHRGAFLIYRACNLLNISDAHIMDAEPLNHGWEERFGIILSSQCMKTFEDSVLKICNCAGKCETMKCGCRSAKLRCTMFCHGKIHCKNL